MSIQSQARSVSAPVAGGPSVSGGGVSAPARSAPTSAARREGVGESLAGADGEAPDMSPLQRSVGRFHGWEPLRIEGELPPGLRGTLIRTGPGLYERFGRRLSHSFEGDGVLMGLRLSADGQAHGAVRVVEGPGYREEEAAGKPLYHSATSRWRRIANGLRGKIKATGNTNVMHWQGKTYALMEASRPLEIEATTLGTYGSSHLGGVVGMAFSAHPHRVVSKRTTFNFGLEFGFDVGWPPRVTSKLALYALPDEGRGRKLGEVELPWVTMVHDFAVSEQHMVFVICPAKLNVLKVLSGHPDMGEYFDWDEASHAELLVVPINDPSRALRLPLPARWVFHLSNAFERDGQLLIDWVQYPDFEVFAALGSQGSIADIRAARLQRLVLDLGSGKLRSDEVLWNHSSDFPVLPPGRVGHAYTTCWYTHFGDAETGGGVSRVDVESGAVDSWTPGRGYSPSEAVFVPRPGAQADDDGWLLPLVYDGWARKSFFAVLDAARPSAGPLAKLWYDQPLPVTFHGTFIPATS